LTLLFEHSIIPRYTRFTPAVNATTIQDIYTALITDEQRNGMIFDDVLTALEQGRRPLLLQAERADI
jgi:hypothetical protein